LNKKATVIIPMLRRAACEQEKKIIRKTGFVLDVYKNEVK